MGDGHGVFSDIKVDGMQSLPYGIVLPDII
jgi:hypothetical protein